MIGRQVNQTPSASSSVGRKRVETENPQDLTRTLRWREKAISQSVVKPEIDFEVKTEQKKDLLVLSVSVLL